MAGTRTCSSALKVYTTRAACLPISRLRCAGPRRLGGVRVAAAASSWAAPPHSGYHFDGSDRRFFEGWYWKVTLPDCGQSFAVIFSVEDPGNTSSSVRGVGAQVMGVDDGYICQFSQDTSIFWGAKNSLELGACFQPSRAVRPQLVPRKMVSQAEFDSAVESGFQASATWQQGSIVAAESGAAGAPMSTVQSCSWAFSINPIVGYGDAATAGSSMKSGKATAGWLSMLQVFEPHWQVLMSHGTADGWIQWGDKRYEFTGAPAYAEKNWGGGFPSKWIWVQCNTFDGMPGLGLTAVGARRGLLSVPGLEEDVGMVGVHLPGGRCIELTPWWGDVEWSADGWGRWWITAKSKEYEALVEATCEQEAGAVLRAPTATLGLAPHCKDTFFGTCRLRVWQVDSAGRRSTSPLVDAVSTTAALEVGGGPWWTTWSAKADMKEPFRSLVQLPIDIGALAQMVPQPLRPPGL